MTGAIMSRLMHFCEECKMAGPQLTESESGRLPGAQSATVATEQRLEPAGSVTEQRRVSWVAVVREVAETIVLTLLIFLLIRNVAQNFRVEGSSMEPNFHDRQFLIVNRFAYCPGFHLDIPFLDIHWQKVWCVWEPKRGDVVVFHAPDQPKEYIKRVIGLPGETVQLDKGQVLVDGQPLDEPYETRRNTRSSPAVTLGPNELFVMGDNRPNSRDSRNWGALPMDAVVGRTLLSYWPPEHWSIVSRATFTEIGW
jgi:signal peptidase I